MSAFDNGFQQFGDVISCMQMWSGEEIAVLGIREMRNLALHAGTNMINKGCVYRFLLSIFLQFTHYNILHADLSYNISNYQTFVG